MLKKSLDLVYANICRPISWASLGGSCFFLLIMDDHLRLMWVAILKQKFDALVAFKRFKVLPENDKETKIKCLRTDRGDEFKSKEFDVFCDSNGIKRQLMAPYHPQHNIVVERHNMTMMSLVKSMLKEKHLLYICWTGPPPRVLVGRCRMRPGLVRSPKSIIWESSYWWRMLRRSSSIWRS